MLERSKRQNEGHAAFTVLWLGITFDQQKRITKKIAYILIEVKFQKGVIIKIRPNIVMSWHIFVL